MISRLQEWAISRFVGAVESNPEVHIEQRQDAAARLDLIGNLVIVRAGLAGLISGMAVIALAFFLYEHPAAADLSPAVVFIALTVASSLATAFELVFIYRDALRTAARMASILGIPSDDMETVGLEHSIPHWLIHAALGAPGFKGMMFGIDPLARIGKLGNTIRKLMSKLRVVASATMFKIILRRMWGRLIGRVAVRAYSMVAALPFFILLNMYGTRSMIRDMRSRLVGHDLTPKLVAHAFPEGIDGLSAGLYHEVYDGLNEQIHTARFMHPNQIRFLLMLPNETPPKTSGNVDEKRRAHRFLLALFCMSGDATPRCRKLIRRLEDHLGSAEVAEIRQEINDAIHDLTPLTRPWL